MPDDTVLTMRREGSDSVAMTTTVGESELRDRVKGRKVGSILRVDDNTILAEHLAGKPAPDSV